MSPEPLLCPKCSGKVATRPMKAWKFGVYDVKRYECQSCGAMFNHYEGAKESFTIPKPKK